MITKENMKYSLKNLWIRKTRSFLTLLSIFIGITTIFIFISFGLGLYEYVNEMASTGSVDKFTVSAKGAGVPGTSTIKLTDTDLNVVEKTKGVYEVTAIYFAPVEIKQKNSLRYSFVIGIDTKTDIFTQISGIDILKGRKLKKDDSGKAVLGYNYQLQDIIFPKPYKIGDNIEVNGIKFDIIGFYEAVGNPSDDSQIYITNDNFKKIFPDKSYYMFVGRTDIDKMSDTVERVKKELRKSRNQEEGQEDFTVSSFEDQIRAFTSALDIVVAFVVLIALISVVVSAVNTANTMVTSVLERIKEIGVIKSIGAKNSEIFNIFLFESAFLGFVAGVIGVLLGWVITIIAHRALDALGWGFLSPSESWMIFAGGIAFATIVGAISGVAPAINASKLKPVDALRYE